MIFATTTYPLRRFFGPSNTGINARTAACATMPPSQDRYEVSLDLVTIAGTEYTMQANLTQYEDVAELEDDILCFLPTVSDLDVFGCELDLLDLHTQQPLPEAFRTALLQRPQLQIVVRPCMVDGHSIWQFQEDGKESYPKAVRVPVNPRGEIADRAFYAAPSLRHVEVAMGIQHVGIAAWQSCQLLQIVKLPPSVISLAEGTFQGCYVLREVAAPGCVQYSRRVFAECCSLGRVGVSHETEDSNVLAPGAQLGKYAFESCLTLTTITFDVDHTNKPRALPEGAFCGAGIEQLCLPSDFHNIGPRACENCKRLVEVNLMGTEITALLYSTFAHCVALHCIWLPPRLTQIGKEVFLNCVMLQEVVIPTELSDIGNRAFCGCEQLQRFTPLDWGDIEQWAQAEHNAFFMCDKFEKPRWVELLSADGPDSDAFDEELYQEYS